MTNHIKDLDWLLEEPDSSPFLRLELMPTAHVRLDNVGVMRW